MSSAHPIRIRVVNVVTDKETWLTVGYIPQVFAKIEASQQEKASTTRGLLMQRVLFLVFRRMMQASHFGVWFSMGDGTRVLASPRLLLYVGDYIEERALLCLKQHGSDWDCTHCMAASSVFATEAGRSAAPRRVAETVRAQLHCAAVHSGPGAGRRRDDLQRMHGIQPRVPCLAGWGGLGSGPELLYSIPGFDRLHVCGASHLINVPYLV